MRLRSRTRLDMCINNDNLSVLFFLSKAGMVSVAVLQSSSRSLYFSHIICNMM